VQLNYIFDQAVSSLPAGFVSALNAVATFFDRLIKNPINVTIEVGYGEITQDGAQTAVSSGSVGGPDAGETLSYATLVADLKANVSSAADRKAIAALPATDPSNGAGIYISVAQEKSLGLVTANTTEIDGSVGFQVDGANGFNYNYGPDRANGTGWDFIGVAEHEISHALGRDSGLSATTSDWNEMDLFRYTSAGTLSHNANQFAYFSIDGGVTNLDNFATSSDWGDWAASAGDDSFDAISETGVENPVTATDVTLMSVLGFDVTTTRNDFNGDGVSDILLQNGGTVVDWTMRNGAISGAQAFGVASGYTVVGTGDFSDSGTADILFENSSGGLVDWLMSKGQPSGGGVIGTVGSGWNVVGTGDFNGDGTSDILFQNTSAGGVAIWDMANGAVSGQSYFSVSAGYNVVGTGDFNGDGTSDILFENASTGSIVEWLMQNGTIASAKAFSVPAGWNVAGTGDFNNDGTSDILFQNASSGEVVDWTMQNGAISGSNDMGNAAGHTIVGVGDFYGTGTSDVLFEGGGSLVDWTVKNSTVVSGATIAQLNSGWNVI